MKDCKTMKKIIGNAFSLQMLIDTVANIQVDPIAKEEIAFNECESAIGHQDLADHLNVPMNRTNIKLSSKDTLYVAQFTGGRLPEGTTMLQAEQMGLLQYFKIGVSYPFREHISQIILDNPENYGLI
jgi:hypothetical protein